MNDRVRQSVVTAAEVFCVLGSLVGSGALGTEVSQSSGGALSADATLLAPLGPAFSIWSVIYLGLAAYTVLQWLPSRTRDPRHRAIGWWVAASMVLNASWLLVTQQGWVNASVVVILALLAVLVMTVRALQRHPADGLAERVVTDGTFGLYLGWVALATFANVAAAIAASGASASTGVQEAGAVVALVVVLALGATLTLRLGARVTVTAAIVWGLAWLSVGRLSDTPASDVVGYAALVVAALLVVVLGVARVRHRGTPAASARQDADNRVAVHA